jgi:ankyrin repeat protein
MDEFLHWFQYVKNTFMHPTNPESPPPITTSYVHCPSDGGLLPGSQTEAYGSPCLPDSMYHSISRAFETHKLSVAPKIQVLIPSSYTRAFELSPEVICGSSSAVTGVDALQNAYLRLLVFSITNNYDIGMSSNHLWTYLKSSEDKLLLFIQSFPGPTSDVLVTKLFEHAIKNRSTEHVSMLLKTGLVDINKKISGSWSILNRRALGSHLQERILTPLALACLLVEPTMVRTLLDHGADVDKYYYTYIPTNNPRLKTSIEDIKAIVKLLVQSGAPVSRDVLRVAMSYQDSELFEYLLDNISSDCCTEIFKDTTLEVSLRFLEDSAARKVINLSIYSFCNGFPNAGPQELHRSRINWNRKPNNSNGKMSSPSRLLRTVIHSGNIPVVIRLLESGTALLNERELKEELLYHHNFDDARSLLNSISNFAQASSADSPFQATIKENCKIIDIVSNAQFESKLRMKSSLDTAVVAGDEDTVSNVLSRYRRWSPNYTRSLLIQSINFGQEKIALSLLKAGAGRHLYRPEGCNRSCDEPLCSAIKTEMIQIVEELLRCGARVTAHAFSLALDSRDDALVRVLVRDVQVLQRITSEHLAKAVKRRNINTLKYLVAAGVDFNQSLTSSNMSALEAAVESGRADILQYLLSIRVDAGDRRALRRAVQCGRRDILVFLLESISSQYSGTRCFNDLALGEAMKQEDASLIEDLLFFPKDKHRHAVCACIEITVFGERQMQAIALRALGRSGVDLNAPRPLRENAVEKRIPRWEPLSEFLFTISSFTPLLLAIGTQNLELVKLLIDNGADVNHPAAWTIMRTPLQMACETGNLEIIQVLFEHGAWINAPPAVERGGTALQLAAIKGYGGIVELLLSLGADVNAAPSPVNGRTALEGAAEHGRLDTVKLLLLSGAKTRGSMRSQYKLAVRRATENCHWGVVQVLEAWDSEAKTVGSTITDDMSSDDEMSVASDDAETYWLSQME